MLAVTGACGGFALQPARGSHDSRSSASSARAVVAGRAFVRQRHRLRSPGERRHAGARGAGVHRAHATSPRRRCEIESCVRAAGYARARQSGRACQTRQRHLGSKCQSGGDARAIALLPRLPASQLEHGARSRLGSGHCRGRLSERAQTDPLRARARPLEGHARATRATTARTSRIDGLIERGGRARDEKPGPARVATGPGVLGALTRHWRYFRRHWGPALRSFAGICCGRFPSHRSARASQGAAAERTRIRAGANRQLEKKMASISSRTCCSVCSRAIAISFTIRERAVSSMRRSPNESCLLALSRYRSRRTSATS